MKPDPLLEYTWRYVALDWLAPLTVNGWRYGAVKRAWSLVSICIAIRVTQGARYFCNCMYRHIGHSRDLTPC